MKRFLVAILLFACLPAQAETYTGDFTVGRLYENRTCLGCTVVVEEGYAVSIKHPTEGYWDITRDSFIVGSAADGPVSSFTINQKKAKKYRK